MKEREKVQKASTKLLAAKQEELSRMEALIKEKKALQSVLNQGGCQLTHTQVSKVDVVPLSPLSPPLNS